MVGWVDGVSSMKRLPVGPRDSDARALGRRWQIGKRQTAAFNVLSPAAHVAAEHGLMCDAVMLVGPSSFEKGEHDAVNLTTCVWFCPCRAFLGAHYSFHVSRISLKMSASITSAIFRKASAIPGAIT